jgi:hypothetical protein
MARGLGFRVCFVAGTPIRWQHGAKAIEEFKSYEEYGENCDLIVSRNEHEPDGGLTLRKVLRKFVRLGPVLELNAGGRIIGTTAEHPLFVNGRGWTPAQELKVGDEIRLMEPGWVRVEGVEDTGRIETVYNLEIEDDHTYFVGCDEWGFSVWAHNAYDPLIDHPLVRQASHRLVQRVTREALAAIAANQPTGTPVTVYGVMLRTRGRAGGAGVTKINVAPSANGRGPALAVVHDPLTDGIFIAQNAAELPAVLHPIMSMRIIERHIVAGKLNFETGEVAAYAPQYPGFPGTHAEAIALNQALLAREALGRSVLIPDLRGFTLNVVQTGMDPGMSGWGQSFIRCLNCRLLTRGADVISDRLDTHTGTWQCTTGTWGHGKCQHGHDHLIIPQPPPP